MPRRKLRGEPLEGRGLRCATALESSRDKLGRGVWQEQSSGGQEAAAAGLLPSNSERAPPSPRLLPISTHEPQAQAAAQGEMPAAPCAEGWSRGRTEAGGGCGGEDRCNHGSQHHPLRCSLSPAPVITAGRKEGRHPRSDAPAAGSPFLPLQARSSPALPT